MAARRHHRSRAAERGTAAFHATLPATALAVTRAAGGNVANDSLGAMALRAGVRGAIAISARRPRR